MNNQQDYSFEVYAIVEPEGFFSSMSLQNNILVPRDTLEEIMMASGQVSALYMRLQHLLVHILDNHHHQNMEKHHMEFLI